MGLLVFVIIIIVLLIVKKKQDSTSNISKVGAAELQTPQNNAATSTNTVSDNVEKNSVSVHKEENNTQADTGNSGLTPHQQENEKIKAVILQNMEPGKRYMIVDMLETFDGFPPGMSVARLTALLSHLGARGTQQIVRTEEKGKAYFSLAQDEKTDYHQENEKIKAGILKNMEPGSRYTIADMLARFDCFPLYMTPQRLSALLAELGTRGTQQIVRTEEKGKAYFSLADDHHEHGNEGNTDTLNNYETTKPRKENRLNFFIDTATLDKLHSDMERWESDEINYTENSFTVDVIDLPLMLLYEADPGKTSTKIFYRTEHYSHDGNPALLYGEVALGKGELLQFKVSNNDPKTGQMTAALNVCCGKISGFMLEEGLDKKYTAFDPEKQGLLIEANGNDYTARLVSGNDRPAIDCITASGDVRRIRV